MSDPFNYPKLRWPIDIRLERLESEEILLVRCPIGVSPTPLFLMPAVAPIISCFEGKLSLDQITQKFSAYGIQKEIIQRIVSLLDDNLFLATPKFFAAQENVRRSFLASEIRPAALAGVSYPLERNDLQKEIDKHLANGNGISKQVRGRMVGLVSPHVDYRRGGLSYGITYNHLRPESHDLFILMGTAHQFSNHLFHLTAKDFDSPLGKLACDREFITKLAQRYGLERSFADELLHRMEHSLELQTPFIRRLKDSPTIAPILVGSFHRMVHRSKLPSEVDEYESFVASLVECVNERLALGSKVCFIAGVDMAHVGRAFGDQGSLTQDKMAEVERRDQEYLQALVTQDKAKLLNHIAEDGDARRICGFPTMYTILDVLDRLGVKYKADIFDYRQAVDYNTDCGVTFAGLGFYLDA